MTAPKAAPLRSKQSRCHGIIATEMWLARGEESARSAARLEGLVGVEGQGRGATKFVSTERCALGVLLALKSRERREATIRLLNRRHKM